MSFRGEHNLGCNRRLAGEALGVAYGALYSEGHEEASG